MSTVVHILRSFGNKNQDYTKFFLEKLNKSSNKNTHSVVCDLILKKSKKISVNKTGTLNFINYNLITLFLKTLFFDTEFKEVFSKYSLKQKIKILIKWNLLIVKGNDIVHIHHLQTVTEDLLKYLHKKDIKLIASLRGRDLLVNTLDESAKNILLNKLEHVSVVHVISNYMKEEALKLNITNEIVPIYRGSTIKMPLSKFSKDNINSSSINIIVVGRLVWEKGHIYAIDSVYRLISKGYNIILDIYGDGILEEFLKFRIMQLGLEKHVHLKGHLPIDELRAKYVNYDLAVQSSISEALSNGLLDLALHGLPCVISNVGGMKEIILDEVNGISFNIKTPLDLDTAILKTLKLDLSKLHEYNKILEVKFSIKEEIKKFETLYATL